uniref:Ovule protein n=1 Tax=Rodentolepis nana TaxID=102285 RepID=A0A0R3TZ87_RODNA
GALSRAEETRLEISIVLEYLEESNGGGERKFRLGLRSRFTKRRAVRIFSREPFPLGYLKRPSYTFIPKSIFRIIWIYLHVFQPKRSHRRFFLR